MSSYPLNESEIKDALNHLHQWTAKDNQLYRKYQFSSFTDAIAWMVSVAFFAEQIGHHPMWLNVYNSVEVHLTTHDLGHLISNLDVQLALKMEELFKAYQPNS